MNTNVLRIVMSDGITSTRFHPSLHGDITDSSGGRFHDHNHKATRDRNSPHEYNQRPRYARIASIHPGERLIKRSWPPFPRVEDEATSLSHEYQSPVPGIETSEAAFRGEIDQQPIILEVNPPILTVPAKSQSENRGKESRSLNSRSSSESLGPHTPESTDKNQDRRYVYIPEKGIEIPLTYDEPRMEIKSGLKTHEKERGRQNTPRLDTNLSRQNSPEPAPSSLEKERSPYAHAPKPMKPRETRFSGEYLLSPDVLSPRIRLPEISHAAQTPAIPDRNISDQAAGNPKYPVRPSMRRNVSATEYPSQPVSAASPRHRSMRYEKSSDESDDSPDESSRMHPSKTSGHHPSDLARERPVPHFNRPVPLKERKVNQRAMSPPLRSLSACDHRGPAPRILSHTSLGSYSESNPPSNLEVNTRRASPRCSPPSTRQSSPAATPPVTPPSSIHQRNVEVQPIKRTTLPVSRPSSPSLTPQSAKILERLPVDTMETGEGRPAIRSRRTSPLPSPGYHSSSSRAHQPRSGQNSPLPSPRHEGSGFEPGPHIDIRETSPGGHHRSSSYRGDPMQRCSTRHASLLPLDMPSSPKLRLPETGHRRRASSNTETRPSLATDSLTLQKAFESPQAAMRLRPLGSTRAVSVGPAPPATLPSCPRKERVAGYNDWYTLVGFPSFAICPTCRDAVMIPGYAHNFIPRAPKSRVQKTRCDFGVLWTRMAWLMTLSQKRPDLNILYVMAEVAAHEPSCPGKVETVREWYKIDDPETGRNVSNFNVCSYCVRNVETLFPVLRGSFHKARKHQSAQKRICDLRIDSQRFSCYVDLLEETANQAIRFRRAPNTLRFVEFAKRMVVNQECPQEDVLYGQGWYIIPHVPEFTACEECYDLIVCPVVERGSSLAAQFTRKPQFVAPPHIGISCQLYSPRMKKVFREACERNDLQHLRNVAVQRHTAERNLQTWQLEAHRYSEDEKVDRLADLVREWRRWE